MLIINHFTDQWAKDAVADMTNSQDPMSFQP